MRKIFYQEIVVYALTFREYVQSRRGPDFSERDSLEIVRQLRQLIDLAGKPNSYVWAGIGTRYRRTGVNKIGLNAHQNKISVLIYSSSPGYFQNRGLGIAAGADYSNGGNGFGLYQFPLSPDHGLPGNKNVPFGFSDRRSFVKHKCAPFSSPVQNDYFTSFSGRKTGIQPPGALKYAAGKFKRSTCLDAVKAGNRIRFFEIANTGLPAFSLKRITSHPFSWYGVWDKSNGVGFTSTLMGNAGAGKTTMRHATNTIRVYDFYNKWSRSPGFQQDQFRLQSTVLNPVRNDTLATIILYTNAGLIFVSQLWVKKGFSGYFFLISGILFNFELVNK